MLEMIMRNNKKTMIISVIILSLFMFSEVLGAPPKIVKTVPENNAKDVDPRLKEIRFVFDQDMFTGQNYSICGGGESYPDTVGKPQWLNKRTLGIRVRLRPEHNYSMSINCPSSYKACKSIDGQSAEYYPFSFTTGSIQDRDAKAEQPERSEPSGKEDKKLNFSLCDAFGRYVHSEDYNGCPVLIMCGACWCGGCQQDSAPLREIADEYLPKGLAVIRSVSGDNELAALEFQKHYRFGFPQLMDTNRQFEKKYNPDGWTFLMLSDSEGNIVYKCNSPEQSDWSKIKQTIDSMLSKSKPEKEVMVEGIAYRPATIARSGEQAKVKLRDSFSSLACGKNGKVYVVFTTNRNGNSDIFIRAFDGEKWSDDKPVAATDADEYDADVLIDSNNRLWVSWTSNADGKNYNIFIKSFNDIAKQSQAEQITRAYDDAMHARLASDQKGRVWITYYKWQKMGTSSRDKEVYVRRFESGGWSDELQVSPIDVPQYEDHTEPAIICIGDGAVISWSWDFHQPEGYPKSAKDPSIFLRLVRDAFDMGPAVAISQQQIDMTPTVVVDKERVWCAWDSVVWDTSLSQNRRQICVGSVGIGRGGQVSEPEDLSGIVANICTPRLVASKTMITALWSQTSDGKKWILKRADYDSIGGRWSEAKTIDAEGNPRYCSAGYDSSGQLWVSYSAQTDKGREIIVRKIE
jgi:peroxiredoxin